MCLSVANWQMQCNSGHFQLTSCLHLPNIFTFQYMFFLVIIMAAEIAAAVFILLFRNKVCLSVKNGCVAPMFCLLLLHLAVRSVLNPRTCVMMAWCAVSPKGVAVESNWRLVWYRRYGVARCCVGHVCALIYEESHQHFIGAKEFDLDRRKKKEFKE